jgi:hypothetical protein
VSDDDDDLELPDDPQAEFDLCGCGCWRSEHDDSGRCRYCFDCEGFTYDEEGTVLANSMSGAGHED